MVTASWHADGVVWRDSVVACGDGVVVTALLISYSRLVSCMLWHGISWCGDGVVVPWCTGDHVVVG